MKKTTAKWMLAAALLTVIGLVIGFSSFAAAGFDFNILNTKDFTKNSYTLTESFNNLSFATDTADIVFIPTDDGTARVECYEFEDELHDVKIEDGTLKVTKPENTYLTGIISFTVTSPKITVFIPKGEFGTLKIETSTGDVCIPADLSFESIDVLTSTGDCELYSSSKSYVKCSTDTGDVTVANAKCTVLDVVVSGANVSLSSITCTGDATVRITTGDLHVNTVRASSFSTFGSAGDAQIELVTVARGLTVERSTGDVELARCIADSFTVSTTTGDVEFSACDCAALNVSTVTGDVCGSLLSPKIFSANTKTGDVSIPTGQLGGLAVINTTTGDIYFEIIN